MFVLQAGCPPDEVRKNHHLLQEALDLDGLLELQTDLMFVANHFPYTSRTIAQTQPADELNQFHDNILHTLGDAKKAYSLSLQRLETLFDHLKAETEPPARPTGNIEQLSFIPCTTIAKLSAKHEPVTASHVHVDLLQHSNLLNTLHPRNR